MKILGQINGVEVKFDFYPPNTFIGVVPKSLSGIYITQFAIQDEAGNITNDADLYMYLNFQSMDFKMLDDKYQFDPNNANYLYKICDNDYGVNINITGYTSQLCPSNYSFKELM